MDRESLQKLFVCPTCDKYTSKLLSMGRWECSFHPGTYDVDTGYSCCGKKVREIRYNPISVALGQQEHYVPEPKGCTPCDCGGIQGNIHIEDIASFVDIIEVDKWKGFAYPILHTNKQSYDNSIGT